MKALQQNHFSLSQRFIRYDKKNTLALFFSFAFTFLLATTMLVLLHTSHRVENIQYQAIFTPSDCYLEGLSGKQTAQLAANPDIERLAVEAETSATYMRNQQPLFLSRGDAASLTMTAKLLEGRFPQTADEVAAERWTLLNLGIEPVINQTFTMQDEDGQEKSVKLVGILSDIIRNKMYATLYLYAGMEKQPDDSYLAYIRLKNPASYESVMANILSDLEIHSNQLHQNPCREDKLELYWMDVKVLGIIFLVCYVVFYGIYRIALLSREKQYGILRATGMKRRQLQHMILSELSQIYGLGAAFGIAAGLFLAALIVTISGDGDIIVYLYNEKVPFTPVVPIGPIACSVAAMAVCVGLTGCLTAARIARKPAAEVITAVPQRQTGSFPMFRLKSTGGKLQSLVSLSCRYLLGDIRTSAFLALTICIGILLFTGLSYQAEVASTIREDTKETWYLNGQYEMGLMAFDSPYDGLSRKNAEKLKQLAEVTKIKTAAGIPVRVIDEDSAARNDAYYEEMNARIKRIYGYEARGHDGTNQIYHSVLYGYNTEALKELKKYVISGDYDPQNLKEDEIIVSILSMYHTSEIPGTYRNGEPLMHYRAGDTIQLKYRADFQTDTLEYESLQDTGQPYIYKTYKIAAIVSFSYMQDVKRTVYPIFITSDQQMQQILPDGHLQMIYIDTGQAELSDAAQDRLERELIRIGSAADNRYVRTRSMITEIKKNEMYYKKQMVYLCGSAITAFLLSLIYILNNLRYRMYARTREICMLRAVGLRVAMAKQIMMTENAIVSTAAIIASYALSQPVLRYLYKISALEAQGHAFAFPYVAFSGISAAAALLCTLLSRRILPSWKTRQITQEIRES